MFTDLLNQSVKSSFSGYTEPQLSKNHWNRFITPLQVPSRDVSAVQSVAKHDFTAELEPIVTASGMPIDNAMICVNKETRKPLGNGVVSSGYGITQPADLYKIASDLIKMNGEIAITDVITRSDNHFIGLQLNLGDWRPTGDSLDTIKNNVTLYTTFDGTKPTGLKTSSFRVVCANTFAMAKIAHSIKHTKNANLDELRRLLGIVEKEVTKMNSDIQSLVYKSMTNGQATDWFSQLLLNGKDANELKGRAKTVHDNRISEFENLLRRGAGCEAGEGTRYAAFNALTNYTTHERATRVTGQNGDASELRWESNLFGSSADFAQRGVEQLVKM